MGTLRISPVTVAQVGGMQSQAVSNPSTQAQNSNTTASSTNLSGFTTINTSQITNGQIELSITPDSVIADVVAAMKSDETTVVSPSGFSSNRITPSYNDLSSSPTLNQNSIDNVKEFFDTRSFRSTEEIGISTTRPEIVMMTQFKPLFDQSYDSIRSFNALTAEESGFSQFMTEAGLYCDAQIQVRNIKVFNALSAVGTLTSKIPSIKQEYKSANKKLQSHLDSMKATYEFLLMLMRRMNSVRSNMDLRDSIYSTDPQEIARTHLTNYSQLRFNFLASPVLTHARKFMPTAYSLTDCLVKLGYDRKSVSDVFMSSKLWAQLLIEYKSMLKFHSLNFLDIDPVAQKNDKNAISITRTDANLFNVSDANIAELISLSQINASPADSVRSVTSVIENAFSSIYNKGAHFKTPEARIAALFHLFSREYKYSTALGKPEAVRALSEKYSYTVSTTNNNTSMFDALIGEYRNNVIDFPLAESKSLIGVSQRLPTNRVAVLTFEPDYIDGVQGTYTPGSEYYLVNNLQGEGNNVSFNTTRIDQLVDSSKQSYQDFNVIVDALNLLSTVDVDPRRRSSTGDIFESAPSFVRGVLDSFIDRTTGTTKKLLADDTMCAIYTYASQNAQLKSLLFLYTMSRISRAYTSSITSFTSPRLADNTPFTDAVIDKITDVLATTTKNSGFGSRNTTTSDLYLETVSAGFKITTPLTREVDKLMSLFIDMFTKQQGFNGNRTKYSGYLDTTLMMVVFDAVISIIARYGNQSIVGRRTTSVGGTGVVCVINKTTDNHLSQINDLLHRLDAELALVQQMTYAIINVLNRLSTVSKSFSDFLSSQSTTTKMRALASVINDRQLLNLLLDEQQIMLLASTIEDLLSSVTIADKNSASDANKDGTFNVSDEVKLLDDVAVSPKLKNLLFSAFGTNEFTTDRAFNKKILTVGIPLGFTQKLKKRANVRNLSLTARDKRQQDIIRVSVYRMDMLNQDIIYKPKTFLFEMSRFVVRDESKYKFVDEGASLFDISSAIPTRDFGEVDEESSETVSYWNPSLVGQLDTSNSLSSKSYDFLSNVEKAEIVKNHLYSFLLESYVKIMTGANVSEHHFGLTDVDQLLDKSLLGLVIDSHIRDIVGSLQLRNSDPPTTEGVVFGVTSKAKRKLASTGIASISGIAGSVIQSSQAGTIQPQQSAQISPAISLNINPSLNTVSYRNVPAVVQLLTSINEFARIQTSLSDGLKMMKKLLVPRRFDRVFNVAIDPDEFEIDYDKTVATEYGRSAMKRLIDRGDVVSAANDIKTRFIRYIPLVNFVPSVSVDSSSSQSFRYRDRDRREGDMMFDKYFVTIETYEES